MFKYTADQLKDWKKKYGEDKVFEVISGDKKAILHKPSRQDLSYANAGSTQGSDSLKFTEILLKQCWIDGDKEILEDDEHFLGLAPVIEELGKHKEAEIKKL